MPTQPQTLIVLLTLTANALEDAMVQAASDLRHVSAARYAKARIRVLEIMDSLGIRQEEI